MKVICLIFVYLSLDISTLLVTGQNNRESSRYVGANKLNITGIRFMIAVNATWKEDHGCIAYVLTPWLPPGKSWNETQPIQVGNCDKGPATYQITPATDGKSIVSVNVTFYSSDVEDAESPRCQIPFNGTFLVPGPDGYDDELLPNCYVEDSREGAYLTYFWFKIFDWRT